MAHPIATPQTPSARTNLPVDGDGLRRLRIDLAACLRWAARNGLEEGICNHFSAVLPERPDLFLVNPYGLAFAEVTASSLLLCDFHGNVVEGDGLPEATAFHIHAELHRLKPNARAAFHGAVAKIFAAENSAFSGGVPLSAEAVPTPSNGFTDLDEAGHQTVNRHRNALFGEYYFARRTFATRPFSLGMNRLAGEVGEPLLVSFYSLPKITLYPIVLLIFGIGMPSKVAFGAIHGIMPIAIFTLGALRNLPPVLGRTSRALRLTRWQSAWALLFPAARPEIFTGLRLGFSLTLIGTLLGEMFASQRGIGFLLMQAIGLHDTDLIMVLTLLIVSFAITASMALLAIDKQLRHGSS